MASTAEERMDRKAETGDLETRLRALEARLYGERRTRSGKPAKVRLALTDGWGRQLGRQLVKKLASQLLA